jgi:hypothetical protein
MEIVFEHEKRSYFNFHCPGYLQKDIRQKESTSNEKKQIKSQMKNGHGKRMQQTSKQRMYQQRKMR